MANQEHVDLLKSQGPYLWDEWRRTHPKVRPDLQGANLSGLHLEKCNLGLADLSEANLSEADLFNANLTLADLRSANLSKAKLRWTYLKRAQLTKADLRGADLTGAELTEADLSEAIFDATVLNGTNLSRARLGRINLQNGELRGADLSHAHLRGANLTGADLSGSILVKTDLRDATLTNCRVYGVAVWDVRLENAKQLNLIITRFDQPTVAVDDLEVAQFIYLLLYHQKLRNVLNAVTERGVLILGRFGGGGLGVLQAIAAKLREEKYLPIIFDFERLQDRDFTETVKTLVGLARFVIVDLSGPSVPQELSHTVPFFDIPFVPIIEKDRRSYSMFVDLFKYPWMLRPVVEFATVDELLARIPAEVIAPAEEKHQARQKLLDELFNKT
jgi:uncharacterized protein YjbI with pentapeptide repeats